MLPDGAPAWAGDREELWNRVEGFEVRKNARVGREVQVGLAYELSHDDQRALAMEFAQREFVDKGFAVDVAIHNYGKRIPAMGGNEAQVEKLRSWAHNDVPFLEADEAKDCEDLHVLTVRNRDGDVTAYKLYQPHVHFRVTPRTFDGETFSKDKYPSREMNRHETAMNWRYDWPKLQNGYLERAGIDLEVTCTSAEEDAFPTIRREGAKESRAAREIAERAEQLDGTAQTRHQEAREALEADRAFTEALNGAVTEAAVCETPATQDEESFERQHRLVGFYHAMSDRLTHLKDQVPDIAREWRARLDGAKERMRAWFGYRDPPQGTDPPTEDPPTQEEPKL
jgi:hypothetical protein